MKYFLLSISVLLFFSCSVDEPIDKNEISIIPQPERIETGSGYFEFTNSTRISVVDELQLGFAEKFFSRFKKIAGWIPEIGIGLEDADVSFVQSGSVPEEGYSIKVTKDRIVVGASDNAGFFYALQTLRQLLPKEFVTDQQQKEVEWLVPSVIVLDKPQFGWRGYMLDVSRHFFDKEEVKKVLDFMAENKMNRFHWHLADDQGWRVEIKQFPKLTEVGAWRVDYNITDETLSNWWGRPKQKPGEKATYGGYYTQEEIREIVSYAKSKFIEIIPEIDMPGHAQATIAAYPEIGCVNAEPYVATGGVYMNNTYNPGKELTYEFAEKMLNEVMDLFPYRYVHIGGDECNKSQWKIDPYAQAKMKEEGLENEQELQSYFIKRIEKIINERDRIMIGWDEILEGGLAPNATVMSWRGEAGGIKSAKAGHDVIMTPNSYCYIDLKQGHDDFEPNLGYSQLLLSTAYDYKVYPKELTEEERKHILGIQANMWTESISDWSKLEYMTFPRIYAIAENAWTTEQYQDWGDFVRRLISQFDRLELRKIRHSKSAFSPWILHKSFGNKIEVSLTTEADVDIFYTTDGTDPDTTSNRYSKPFLIQESAIVKAAGYYNDERVGKVNSKKFYIHKGITAEVNYNEPYMESKQGAGDRALVDLRYAKMNPGDENWQGFEGNMDAEFLFPNKTELTSVSLASIRHTIGRVYLPSAVKVWGDRGNGEYTQLGEKDLRDISLIQGRNKHNTVVKFEKGEFVRIRVVAENAGIIPLTINTRHKGRKALLYIDEVIFE